jgi:hypothetical protein
MKFKKTWAKWLFGLVCLGSVVYVIFSNDKDSVGITQTASTLKIVSFRSAVHW